MQSREITYGNFRFVIVAAGPSNLAAADAWGVSNGNDAFAQLEVGERLEVERLARERAAEEFPGQAGYITIALVAS